MNNKLTPFDYLSIFIVLGNICNIIINIVYYESILDLIEIIIHSASFICFFIVIPIIKVVSDKQYYYVYSDKHYKFGYDIFSNERKYIKQKVIKNKYIRNQASDNIESIYIYKNKHLYVKYGLINLLNDRKLLTIYKINVNKKIPYDDEIKSQEQNFKAILNTIKIEELCVENIETIKVNDTSQFIIRKKNEYYVVELYSYYFETSFAYITKEFNICPNKWEQNYEFVIQEFETIDAAKNFIDNFIKEDKFYLD